MLLAALALAAAAGLSAADAPPAAAPTTPVSDLGRSLDETGRAALFVDFALNASSLRVSGRTQLAQIADVLRARPKLRVDVETHCDGLATPEENLALSESRWKVLLDELEKLGIERSRLSGKGYGASRPINTPTDPDRAVRRNERVELVDPSFAGVRRALAVEAPDVEPEGTMMFRRFPDYYVARYEEYLSAVNERISALSGGPARGKEMSVAYAHPDAGVSTAKLPSPEEILSQYEQGMRASGGFVVEKSTGEVILSLMQEKQRTWLDVQAPSGKAYTVTTLIEPFED